MVNEIAAKKLLAAIVDIIIIIFAAAGIFELVSLVAKPLISEDFLTPLCNTLFFVSYSVFLLFKDLTFKNTSIGKKLFKLKIEKTDGTQFTILDEIKRNIPILFALFPVEIFLVLFNDGIRIGDIWAKTEVVLDKPQK